MDRWQKTDLGFALVGFLFLSVATLLTTGCANYPIESEVGKFTTINASTFDDGYCWVTFTYEGGYKQTIRASKEQWLQIRHIRNLDWNERKDIRYRLNYRQHGSSYRLLSFYKEE